MFLHYVSDAVAILFLVVIAVAVVLAFFAWWVSKTWGSGT